MKPVILAFSLILPLAFSLTLQEDDLVFDDVGEPASYGVPISAAAADGVHRGNDRKYERLRENKKYNVERLWGIPDTSVVVGHVFKMRILKQAFSGNVDHFEARGINGQSLPHWLGWDEAASTLVGVPSKKDSGIHHVSIKAFGKHGDVAKDVFSINVVAEKKDEVVHKDGKTHCDEAEDQTLLTVVLDTRFESLKPADRVNAIENLAGFLGLHTSAFSMHPQSSKENSPPDASVILSGPGNVKHRREKHSTAIQWQVGCDGRLWHHQTDLVRQLKDQAKDGTLAEVLQQPVFLWRVKTDSSSLLRSRRETGSGDFDENYDDEYIYDDDYEDENENENGNGEDDDETVTEQPQVPNARTNLEEERPHRHHHGEKTIDPPIEDEIDEYDEISRTLSENVNSRMIPRPLPTTTPPPTTTTVLPTTVSPTTTTTTQVPTTVIMTTSPATTPTTTTPTTTTTTTTTTTSAQSTSEANKVETTETAKEKTENIDLSITVPSIIVETTTAQTNTTVLQQTSEISSAISTSAPIKAVPETTVIYNPTTPPPEPNEPITTTTFPTTSTTTTTTTTTTLPPPTTTSPVPVTTPFIQPVEITETIEHAQKNFPPREDKTLQKQQVTAGKPLSFIIPDNTFSDMEDGNTRQLRLSLYWQRKEIQRSHWLQFNKRTQEVYGLPLENAISKWDYELVAQDSEGLNATAILDVHVQQHKLSRVVNHEFSIYLKIEKMSEFPSNVDWQLRVVRSLAELYGDENADQITVRTIDIDGDQAIFTWFNDSLPRGSACPKHQIDKLFHVLVANERGDPSIALQDVLAPEIKVRRVVYQGSRQCEDINTPIIPPSVVTQEPKINQPPVPRNQVDHINATVGQLLIFTVPEDTFFDHEDGSTRNMKLSLMSSNRSPIPGTDWLQFDSKNQQFYGVPLENDVGRKEYQLIVTDKEGASITDGLVVVVRPSTTLQSQHNVEFSMTLFNENNNVLGESANLKRKFIEKIAELFHDKDTSAISLDSITENNIITWHNKTLVTSPCPDKEITQLREVLVKDEQMLTERVHQVMGPEFVVKQITLTPTGLCGGEMPSVLSPSVVPPADDTTSVGKSNDDLIITFIVPAIIIAAMLILAAIIACILYRRKRSGKMSVSEQDDERQSFRNKGIPVIFQDELDEKPDPGNKSPVILKEEKPPLPPPEYQKTEDGADVPMLQSENSEEPYQPPPPFATNRDNNRQNRPKPTPTYRKPPPYVPP